MRRVFWKFLLALTVYGLPACVLGQTPTVVTGTITDLNGLPYSNARVSAQLIPTTASPTILVNNIPVQIGGQQNASSDANGNISMNLFCNTAGGGCSLISPPGTAWQITVTTNGVPPPLGTGPQSCSATLTISGSSQSVTSNFSACPALSRGAAAAAPLSGLGGGGIWQKMGTIIYADPTSATDQGASQEATVICEGSPQVLTAGESTVCGPPGTPPTANAVLKMWFTCGWAPTASICYAEARPSHPEAWFRRAAALIASHASSRVFKNGSTYHLYADQYSGSLRGPIDHYTSSDGITWSLSAAAVIPLGTGGQWDSQQLANNRVWIEGNTWYMLYEAIKAAGQWSIGLATSTDGAGNVWTKNANNPLCTGCGGPFKYKDAAGNYWIWTHSAPAGSQLPSDINRWNLTGLTTNPAMTQNPNGIFVLPRTTFDEGWQSTGTGQLADVMYVEVNNSTYAFYEGTYDGSQQTADIHIKYAVANIPLAAIVLTNEGVAPSARPWDSSLGISIGNPAIAPAPGGLFITNSNKTGYPGFSLQHQSINGTADQTFFGGNAFQSPTGAVTRPNTSYSAWRIGCAVANANNSAGCFWGITNIAGTEGLALQSYPDASGNIYDVIPTHAAGGSVAPTITGTGACGTISGQTGQWAGSFQCTGATAASTVTFTFHSGIASTGWNCTAQDETTRANLLQQTSHSATTAVLTATSVTANDVITFHCHGW